MLTQITFLSGIFLARAAGPANVLWLPLGDSITFGCTGPTAQDCHQEAGSYRVPLAFALSQPPLDPKTGPPSGIGFNITTMGTLFTGPSYVPQQWLRHEGHPGWRIDMIDTQLDKALATSQRRPDLVTIHLGTNDCDQHGTTEVMIRRMDSLLQHIFEKSRYSQVYVADVLNMADRDYATECVKAFNPHVPNITNTWASKGMRVTFVPLNNATGDMCGASGPEADLCGGHQIHPTSAGYPRMASAFALSIMRNFDPVPVSPPATCDVVKENSKENSRLTVGCSDGVISKVVFASFGMPIGSCDHGFQKTSSCDAPSSQSVVEKACLGKTFCSVPVSIDVFGDPCFGHPKSLAVEVSCKSMMVQDA